MFVCDETGPLQAIAGSTCARKVVAAPYKPYQNSIGFEPLLIARISFVSE